jgi:peptidyl-prolyl cis-trans isomerase C
MSLNSFRTGLGSLSSNPLGKGVLFVIGALLIFGLVGFGLFNSGLGTAGSQSGPAQAGTDVIATVNGDPITREDYENSLQALQNSQQVQDHPVTVAQTPLLNNVALEQLINTNLELQLAQKMGLTVTPAEIAKERAQIATEADFRGKLGLPATASLADIDAALAKAQSPSLEQRYPDDTLRRFLIVGDPQSGQPGKLQTAYLNSQPVTDSEARQYYTQYHTQHILIDNKSRSDVQAKAQAEQILAKAKAPGADFAALARQYSDDPGTKAKGGDDGFISETTSYAPYGPEFKKAAFSLKPGEIVSDPVASPQDGYFLIKLDAVKVNLPADYAKNSAQYLTQIKEQRAEDKFRTDLTALKTAAKIDVTDSALGGDRAFTLAQQQPGQSQAKYQEAITDYQKALKDNPSNLQKAAINAALGQAYQSLRQTPQALAAYEAALVAHDDAGLELTTGQLYLQSKDNAKAVAHFQKASQLAWNDQSTHINLQGAFRQAGRTDLAVKEADWLKQYTKAHPVPSTPSGMPNVPGMPAGARVLPAGSVHVAAPPARKPVQ